MKKIIRQIKGFTMIELISVIIVLGLIAAIVTPIVSSVLNDNREKLYQRQLDGIIESAKVWSANNMGKLPEPGDKSIEITLGELKQGGYADKDLKNPKNDKLFDDISTRVIIKNQNGILDYTVIVE